MSDNLREFVAEVERGTTGVAEAVTAIQRRVAADAFADVVAFSPVLTGAYRASHRIATGGDAPAFTIFEHDEAPDPENPPRLDFGETLGPPAQGLAEASLEGIEPYGVVWIVNPIRYAEFVEFGGAATRPHLVYRRAEERAIANLEAAEREAEAGLFRP